MQWNRIMLLHLMTTLLITIFAGYYLYVESSGTRSGQTADLVSPWIPAKSGGQCLKFYYTMYGKTMGSLSIKLELSNGRNWFIFYKIGDQGMQWKSATGNIDVPLGISYRVSYSAIFNNLTRASAHLRSDFA